MPRWGYALVILLAAVLAAYALWPSGAPTSVAAFPDPIPSPFTVTGAFGEQQVGGGRVRVAGMDRPADAEAVGRLQNVAKAIRCDPAKVVDGVDAQAARAWGVDGTRRLAAGDEERSWGEASGTAAVYDPVRRRAYVVDPRAVRDLDASSARLDQKALVDLQANPAWYAADGTRYAVADGRWSASGRLAAAAPAGLPSALNQDLLGAFTARPPVDGRTWALLNLLRAATLNGPGAAPAEAVAEHELRWPAADGIEQRLRILAAGGRAWLAVDGLPAQALDPAAAASWRSVFANLAADRIVDLPPSQPPELVTIARGGAEVLRLERRGEPGDSGLKPWTVVWPGGSEPADDQAGERIANALAGLVVTGAAKAPEPAGPDAWTIDVRPENGTPWRAVLAGTTLWSGGWSGRIAEVPADLRELRAETFLDPRPCALDPVRAVKLQRRWHGEANRDEVSTRAGGGSWARSWPAGGTPVDSQAVQRIVRQLCRLKAIHVRLASPAERAMPADAELAIRFAPKEARRTGAEDEVELVDTVPQERGWTLARTGLAWTMIEVGGSLAFDLAASDAEALLADAASDRLFPIAAALVSAIDIGGPEPFRLERSGEAWRLVRTGSSAVDADALAVRRLLRALAALRAAGPAQVPPADALPVALETVDKERITVTFAPPGADGVPAMTVRGGVLVADREAWAQVELRPSAYLRP